MLKFAFMDHFYSKPNSMMPFMSVADWEELVPVHMEIARSCNSFRHYIDREKNGSPSVTNYLNNDFEMLAFMKSQIEQFTTNRVYCRVVYEILTEVNSCVSVKSHAKMRQIDLLVGIGSLEFIQGSSFEGLMMTIKYVTCFSVLFNICRFMDDEKFFELIVNLKRRFDMLTESNEVLTTDEEFIELQAACEMESDNVPDNRLNLQKLIYSFIKTHHMPIDSLVFNELTFVDNVSRIKKVHLSSPSIITPSHLSRNLVHPFTRH